MLQLLLRPRECGKKMPARECIHLWKQVAHRKVQDTLRACLAYGCGYLLVAVDTPTSATIEGMFSASACIAARRFLLRMSRISRMIQLADDSSWKRSIKRQIIQLGRCLASAMSRHTQGNQAAGHNIFRMNGMHCSPRLNEGFGTNREEDRSIFVMFPQQEPGTKRATDVGGNPVSPVS